MNYECTLYINSGFNVNNIPASPAVLAKAAEGTVTSPVLDLVQNFVLSSVTIPATFNQVKYADYAKIGDFYYMITSISMLSDDTAKIELLPDYILSVGLDKVAFTDGIVERGTISEKEDVFGAFSEDDPLLGCMEPLVLETSDMLFNSASDDEHTLLTSSLALDALAAVSASGTALNALLWQTPDDSYLTTPDTTSFAISKDYFTKYKLSVLDKVVTSPGTCVFDADKGIIQRGLMVARDLNLSQSVMDQVTIPNDYITVTETDNGAVTQITGKAITAASGLNKEYNKNIRHKRLLYGKFCKYGLISANGSKIEFSSEEIMGDADTQPNVRCIADPRLDGKPYFRYEKYLSDNSINNFFTNAISGLEWRSAPLVYTQGAGSAITRAQASKTLDYQSGTLKNAMASTGISVGTGIISGLGDLMSGKIGDALQKIIGSVSNAALSTTQQLRQYEFQRQQEQMRYAVSTSLVVPEINFPYDAQAVRDFLGNGVIAYRYHPTATDIKRMDRILSEYGYKKTKPLELSDFFVGKHFSYVQASGVQITNLPKWWADGAAQQLEAGVRVWKERPNVAAYDSQL